MQRTLAAIQILVIIAIIAFSTWQMFCGNFEAAFTALPLLLIFYVFVTSRSKRN